jgi:hypothetical protein
MRKLKIIGICTCVLGFSLLAFWVGWRWCEAGTLSKDFRSRNRFAQVELLLHSYHHEHGAFPPIRYKRNANEPTHSWRILLLPYIDMDFKDRYSRYDFSQEWNSPKNLAALRGIHDSNYYSLGPSYDTEYANYLAVGNVDDWPAEEPLRSHLVTDGKDRFLLVEDPDSKIHWMEPKN